jgi:hypothetical protein
VNWKKHNNGMKVGRDWVRQAFNGPARPALERLSEAARDLHAPDWHRLVDAMENDAFGVSGGVYFLMFPDRDKNREAADSFWSALCEGVRCPSREFVGGFVEGALKERDNKLEAIDREKQRPSEAGYDAGRAWYGETVHHWDQSGYLKDLDCDIEKMDQDMVYEELGAPGEDVGEFWGRQTADNNESPSDEFARGFLRGAMAADRNFHGTECHNCGGYFGFDEMEVKTHYRDGHIEDAYCHNCLDEDEFLGAEDWERNHRLTELGKEAGEAWAKTASDQVLDRLANTPQDELDHMESDEVFRLMYPDEDSQGAKAFWSSQWPRDAGAPDDYATDSYFVYGFVSGRGRGYTEDELETRRQQREAAAARQMTSDAELAERRRLESEGRAQRLRHAEADNVFPGFRVAIADNTFTVLNDAGQAKTSVRTSNRDYVELVRACKWREAAEWLYERTDVGNARFREAIHAIVESLSVRQPAQPGRPRGFVRKMLECVGFVKA